MFSLLRSARAPVALAGSMLCQGVLVAQCDAGGGGSPCTADLCDAAGGRCQAAGKGPFRDYGGVARFGGRAATVRCFESNVLVKEALREDGEGRVLVVDGGGSLRCGMLGDNMGELARRNGWAGVVVYGCVRDAEQLCAMQIGVQALGTHPRKSDKLLRGVRGSVLRFHGLVISDGDYIYVDADGFVVSPVPLRA